MANRPTKRWREAMRGDRGNQLENATYLAHLGWARRKDTAALRRKNWGIRRSGKYHARTCTLCRTPTLRVV